MDPTFQAFKLTPEELETAGAKSAINAMSAARKNNPAEIFASVVNGGFAFAEVGGTGCAAYG